MVITSLVHVRLDLLSVGIAVAGIVILGTLIYVNDRASITNRTFFVFALLTALWGVSNYLEYRFSTAIATLWALRSQLFISIWHAFFFFQLAYVFPQRERPFSAWYKWLLLPVVVITAILTLTPYVFSGVTTVAPPGYVTNPSRGPGIVLFSFVAFGLLLCGLFVLAQKTIRAHAEEKKQLGSVFAGMAVMAVLILTFNVLLPVAFNQLSFIPLAALFVLPFIALVSYSIYRHHLLKIKVVTTATIGFLVTVFSFVNVIYSTTISAVAINIAAFCIILLGSIKIVLDTLSLQRVTEELQFTNHRQEGLIHFIGHEVKGYLTKASNVFAMLDEGDFGELPDQAREMVQRALQDTRDGVTSVSDILKASNLKMGTTALNREAFDFADIVRAAAERAKQYAEQKRLTFSLRVEEGNYDYVGDKAELKDHVLRNLMDNAVNYTPAGSVTVTLSRTGQAIVVKIVDTGVGITPEDKKRLFTEGGHGRDSLRTNVHSTGYGLFIAKQMTVAHGGTVTAESEGAGKGSTFTLTLPVDSPAEQQ